RRFLPTRRSSDLWWFSWLLLACRRWRECACYFRVSPRIQPSTARWWCIRTLGGRTARRPHWHVQYPPTRLVKYLRERGTHLPRHGCSCARSRVARARRGTDPEEIESLGLDR